MHLELWRIYSITPWLSYQKEKNQKGFLGHKTAVLLSSTTWTLKEALTWRLSCAPTLDDPQSGRKWLHRVLNLFVFVREKCCPCVQNVKCGWLSVRTSLLTAVRGIVYLDHVVAGCLDSVMLPRTESKKQQLGPARPWPRCSCIATATSIRAPASRPSEGINGFKSPRYHRC